MEKIDVLGLAIVFVAIFTFINILAIGSLFYMVECIRETLTEIIKIIQTDINIQQKINVNHSKINANILSLIAVIAKSVGIDINHNSPTGGKEQSDSERL